MTSGHGEPEQGKIVISVDKDLEDLIPGFLENRRNDVQTMHKALAEQDYETIRRHGHSMKGVGGGYGFAAITEIGGRIEQAATAGDSAAIGEEVGKLEYYLQHIAVVYE